MEFNTNKTMPLSITKVVKLSENDIDDIIVGAIEGGIGYWGYVSPSSKVGKPADEPTSQWCTTTLLAGGTVFIQDNEEPEVYELTLEGLMKGIKWYMEKHDDDMDNWDASSYDCIVQYGMFDKVVFG
jgi:hypothetical protein